MTSTIFDQLKAFRIPVATPVDPGGCLVAHLAGVDFGGFFSSPDFEFDSAIHPGFGKMMVRTASQLLGGDACGVFGYVEQTELSIALDSKAVARRWQEIGVFQHYLVGNASARMTLLVDDPALFVCRMYAFPSPDLMVAYFTWRQQEADLAALDSYCKDVLIRQRGHSADAAASLLEGLGSQEKREILVQNDVDYSEVPAWQRYGTGVFLAEGANVVVDTNLPHDRTYAQYILEHIGA